MKIIAAHKIYIYAETVDTTFVYQQPPPVSSAHKIYINSETVGNTFVYQHINSPLWYRLLIKSTYTLKQLTIPFVYQQPPLVSSAHKIYIYSETVGNTVAYQQSPLVSSAHKIYINSETVGNTFAYQQPPLVTLNIFYCSILNNWIGHKFHNLEASSPTHNE
jgi:hypothetical protein